MCGRMTLSADIEKLKKRFGFRGDDPDDYAPHFNIAPTQLVLTLIEGHEPRMLRWGLVPFWSKDLSQGAKMINARAESIADKPAFKRLLEKRRCLILADGFYEWKREGKNKTPMFIG